MVRKSGPGPLFIIGGGEDRDPGGDRDILCELARRAPGDKIVIATCATRDPGEVFDRYRKAFRDLDVKQIVHLRIDHREDADDPAKLKPMEGAAALFFTGGDQLRITARIGQTAAEERMRALRAHGCVIAGTSAGASVMSETMLVGGEDDHSHRLGGLEMAPGLGLVRGMLIDQHFAERGRFGRMLGAVAHNPRLLGLGIDENTAAVVEDSHFSVIGCGAVYVVDAGDVTHSNIAEGRSHEVLSLHDVKVHVLECGDGFDIARRRPSPANGKQTAAQA